MNMLKKIKIENKLNDMAIKFKLLILMIIFCFMVTIESIWIDLLSSSYSLLNIFCCFIIIFQGYYFIKIITFLNYKLVKDLRKKWKKIN